jgi:uncharacterized OB-fold protein
VGSRGSLVAVVTELRVRQPRNRGSISDGDRYFSFLQGVKTGSGVLPASCPVCTEVYFPEERVDRACTSPIIVRAEVRNASARGWIVYLRGVGLN